MVSYAYKSGKRIRGFFRFARKNFTATQIWTLYILSGFYNRTEQSEYGFLGHERMKNKQLSNSNYDIFVGFIKDKESNEPPLICFILLNIYIYIYIYILEDLKSCTIQAYIYI